MGVKKFKKKMKSMKLVAFVLMAVLSLCQGQIANDVQINLLPNPHFELNDCPQVTTTTSCVINGTAGANQVSGSIIPNWSVSGAAKLIRMPNSLPVFLKYEKESSKYQIFI